ncbi:MAG: glycosyltransferase family 4 protein [Caulobacter sp.]
MPQGAAKPKVLFLSPVPDFKGGAERSMLDLIANPEIEAEVAVPAPGPISEHLNAQGVPVHVIDFGAVNTVRRPLNLGKAAMTLNDAVSAARRLNGLARERGVDVVHSNGLKAHAINVLARRLGGRPSVVHIRDIAYTRPEKAFWVALQKTSTAMVLVSRACWPAGPAAPRNVHVIHNGVAVDAVAETPSAAPGGARLGFIGRIHPSKGLSDLLDWIKAAIDAGQPLTLTVRGKFAPETPEYEGQIADQIARLGLGDVVRMEGFVSDPDKVYENLDLVCVPSSAPDPFPRAVMEAMARGIPVIARPTGGIPEMVTHGETGFLVDDASAFVDVAGRLANDPELAAQIGRQAHAHCASALTLGRLHADMGRLYRSLA